MSDQTAKKTAKRAAKKTAVSERQRRQRTPYERAKETLDIEERRVESLDERITRLESELTPLKAEREEAVERRDYLRMHPDLKKGPKGEEKSTAAALMQGSDQ